MRRVKTTLVVIVALSLICVIAALAATPTEITIKDGANNLVCFSIHSFLSDPSLEAAFAEWIGEGLAANGAIYVTDGISQKAVQYAPGNSLSDQLEQNTANVYEELAAEDVWTVVAVKSGKLVLSKPSTDTPGEVEYFEISAPGEAPVASDYDPDVPDEPEDYKVQMVKDSIGVPALKVIVTILNTEKIVETVTCYGIVKEGKAGTTVYSFIIPLDDTLTDAVVDGILLNPDAWVNENVQVKFKEPLAVETIINKSTTTASNFAGMISLFVYLNEANEDAVVTADGVPVEFDAETGAYLAGGFTAGTTEINVRVDLPDFTYEEYTVTVITI